MSEKTVDVFEEFRQFTRMKKWNVYHTGCLMVDRRRDSLVHKIAKIASGLQKAGKAELMQKRISEHVADYMIYPTVRLSADDLKEAFALSNL